MDSHRFKTPFSMGVYGRRESGKTYFVTKLLSNQELLIDKPFNKVIWVYKSYQNDVYMKLSKIEHLEVVFLDDIPNFDEMGMQINTVVVLDDLLQEGSDNSQVCSLFTRGRHLNFSVIFSSQNLYHQGKHSRDISLNTDYLILYKNPRDATQIRTLGQQMYPQSKHFLSWAYNDAVNKEQYGHLVLDLKPYTDNSMRVLAKIFDLYPVVYVPRNL